MSDDKIIPRPDKPSQLSLFTEPLTIRERLDRIKHTDDPSVKEYWYARELMTTLEYTDWKNFRKVIAKAIRSCDKAKNGSGRHFSEVGKMVDLGNNIQREIEDFKLTRYACDLIAQNGNTSKSVIADAQAYFSGQTHKQEVAEQNRQLKHDQDVTYLRLKGHSEEHALDRVDGKQQQKSKTDAMFATHETHNPDFMALAQLQNNLICDMSKGEVIDYLGLLPAQAKHYRDYMGHYALMAYKESDKIIEYQMRVQKRLLTDDEQRTIVYQTVRRIGPVMREWALLAGVDFLSGAPLDENGKPLLVKNQKLLKG